MVLVPGGEFVAGLSHAQVEKLAELALKYDLEAHISAPGVGENQFKLWMVEEMERLETDGRPVFTEDQIGRLRNDVENLSTDQMLARLTIGQLQAEGVHFPQPELDRWKAQGGSTEALFDLPVVKHALEKEIGADALDASYNRSIDMSASQPARAPSADRLRKLVTELSQEMQPKSRLSVGPFYVDKYEVTNAQYRRFISEVGKDEHLPQIISRGYGLNIMEDGPVHVYGLWSDKRRNGDRQPVTCVSGRDADAYAHWAGKSLPSRLQWQQAATGDAGTLFPWGDEFQIGWCRAAIRDFSEFKPSTTPESQSWLATGLDLVRLGRGIHDIVRGRVPANVGSYPKDRSWVGCYDMAGNVSEWVRTGSDQYLQIGGNAESFSVDELVAARKSSKFASPRLCGFRTILLLGVPDSRSAPPTDEN